MKMVNNKVSTRYKNYSVIFFLKLLEFLHELYANLINKKPLMDRNKLKCNFSKLKQD